MSVGDVRSPLCSFHQSLQSTMGQAQLQSWRFKDIAYVFLLFHFLIAFVVSFKHLITLQALNSVWEMVRCDCLTHLSSRSKISSDFTFHWSHKILEGKKDSVANIKNLLLLFLELYIGVCVAGWWWWVVHPSSDVCRGQWHWIPLELELQVVVSCPTWVLGVKLRSLARVIHAPNCC